MTITGSMAQRDRRALPMASWSRQRSLSRSAERDGASTSIRSDRLGINRLSSGAAERKSDSSSLSGQWAITCSSPSTNGW